jgi:hypothetical protein
MGEVPASPRTRRWFKVFRPRPNHDWPRCFFGRPATIPPRCPTIATPSLPPLQKTSPTRSRSRSAFRARQRPQRRRAHVGDPRQAGVEHLARSAIVVMKEPPIRGAAGPWRRDLLQRAHQRRTAYGDAEA